jgi:hypothetical protein
VDTRVRDWLVTEKVLKAWEYGQAKLIGIVRVTKRAYTEALIREGSKFLGL